MKSGTVKFTKLEDHDNVEGEGEETSESMEFLKMHNEATVIEVKDNNVVVQSNEKGKQEETPIPFLKQFITPKVYFVGLYAGISMIGFNLFCSFVVLKNVAENKNQSSIIDYFKWSPVIMSMVVCIIQPITEEFIFRSMIFGFLRKYSVALAYIISCFLFAFSHFGLNYHLMLDEIIYFPIYLILGIILTIAYDLDKCILASIVGHMINNIVSTIEILYLLYAP